MKEVYNGTERNSKSHALYHHRCFLRHLNSQLFHFHKTEKSTEERKKSHGIPKGEPVYEAGPGLFGHCRSSSFSSPLAFIINKQKRTQPGFSPAAFFFHILSRDLFLVSFPWAQRKCHKSPEPGLSQKILALRKTAPTKALR